MRRVSAKELNAGYGPRQRGGRGGDHRLAHIRKQLAVAGRNEDIGLVGLCGTRYGNKAQDVAVDGTQLISRAIEIICGNCYRQDEGDHAAGLYVAVVADACHLHVGLNLSQSFAVLKNEVGTEISKDEIVEHAPWRLGILFGAHTKAKRAIGHPNLQRDGIFAAIEGLGCCSGVAHLVSNDRNRGLHLVGIKCANGIPGECLCLKLVPAIRHVGQHLIDIDTCIAALAYIVGVVIRSVHNGEVALPRLIHQVVASEIGAFDKRRGIDRSRC